MTFQNQAVESGKRTISDADAMLVGMILVFALLFLDGLFKEALYRRSPTLFWIFDFVKFALVPAIVLAWLRWSHSIAPARYGVRRFDKADHWLRVVATTLLLSALLYFIYHYSSRGLWRFTWWLPQAAFTYPDSLPQGWLHFPAVVYFGLTAGIVEEIFFRGLPLLYLRERFRGRDVRVAYVAVTSVLFGLIHWENGMHEIIATGFFGVLAAIAYLQLRNLWFLIGAHALIDIWAFS